MMVRQRDDARTESNPLGPFGDGCDHQFWRRYDFVACRMVLTNPCLVEADAIEMLDQVDIASERERWVLIDRMKRSEKDSSPQAVWSNSCGHLILSWQYTLSWRLRRVD